MSDLRALENEELGNDAEQRERRRLRDVAGSARQQAARAYGSARDSVGSGLTASRHQAANHPFLTVAGAVAVGAGIGLLLPAGRREKQVMAEVAHKVSDVARDAADSAVEASREQVDEITQKALASVGGAVVQAVVAGAKPDSQ